MHIIVSHDNIRGLTRGQSDTVTLFLAYFSLETVHPDKTSTYHIRAMNHFLDTSSFSLPLCIMFKIFRFIFQFYRNETDFSCVTRPVTSFESVKFSMNLLALEFHLHDYCKECGEHKLSKGTSETRYVDAIFGDSLESEMSSEIQLLSFRGSRLISCSLFPTVVPISLRVCDAIR